MCPSFQRQYFDPFLSILGVNLLGSENDYVTFLFFHYPHNLQFVSVAVHALEIRRASTAQETSTIITRCPPLKCWFSVTK